LPAIQAAMILGDNINIIGQNTVQYIYWFSQEEVMDPITTAIMAAIASGVSKVGEQAVVDAYAKLKDLLKKKFGAKSEVVKAVKGVEAKPDSAARKEVLKEEVAAVKADKDPEMLQAAQMLLKAIKAKPGGDQIIQTAIGDQNIQISGDGNVVSVNTPKSRQ
jgi:hypothetical protein